MINFETLGKREFILLLLTLLWLFLYDILSDDLNEKTKVLCTCEVKICYYFH